MFFLTGTLIIKRNNKKKPHEFWLKSSQENVDRVYYFSKLKVKIYAFCVLFHTDISTAYLVSHKKTEKIKSTKNAEIIYI